jgi:hypothetical protein
MHELVSSLHHRVRTQQCILEKQICLLTQAHKELHDVSSEAYCNTNESPRTIAELRQRTERMVAHLTQGNAYASSVLLISEKESPSSVFLKYSQQLLKWAELELSLLKGESKEVAAVEDIPLTDDEIQMLREFLIVEGTEKVK